MQLLELMDAREEKLTAAGELHRFNRDVAEALQRIQVGTRCRYTATVSCQLVLSSSSVVSGFNSWISKWCHIVGLKSKHIQLSIALSLLLSMYRYLEPVGSSCARLCRVSDRLSLTRLDAAPRRSTPRSRTTWAAVCRLCTRSSGDTRASKTTWSPSRPSSRWVFPTEYLWSRGSSQDWRLPRYCSF